MIEFAIALALAQKLGWGVHTPVDYSLLSDEWHCEHLRRLHEETSRRLPETMDGITSAVRNSLDCNERLMTTDRSVARNLSDMAEGWQTDSQSGWDNEICNSNLFAVLARRGWRFTLNLSFQSGEHVRMDADCPRF